MTSTADAELRNEIGKYVNGVWHVITHDGVPVTFEQLRQAFADQAELERQKAALREVARMAEDFGRRCTLAGEGGLPRLRAEAAELNAAARAVLAQTDRQRPAT